MRGQRIPYLACSDFGRPGVRSGMWVDGAIHGGELASAEPVLALAEALREEIALGQPPEFLERVIFYLVPVINVDGRALSIRAPYLDQRRNLQPRGGIDLNRDFPVCTTANSALRPQPETAAVMRFWRSHPEIELAVSYHTSINALLRPRMAMPRADRARYDLFGRIYRRCCGHEELVAPERARGTSMEWFYLVRNAIAFTIEMAPSQEPARGGRGPATRAARPREKRYAREREALLESALDDLVGRQTTCLLRMAAQLPLRPQPRSAPRATRRL